MDAAAGNRDDPRLRRRALLGAAAAVPPVAVAARVLETDCGERPDRRLVGAVRHGWRRHPRHADAHRRGAVLPVRRGAAGATARRTSRPGTGGRACSGRHRSPRPRDVFCAGHNVLPDGRVFIAGGHDPNTGKKQDAVGVVETDIFDPVSPHLDPHRAARPEALVPDERRTAERQGPGVRWHCQPGSRSRQPSTSTTPRPTRCGGCRAPPTRAWACTRGCTCWPTGGC